MAPVAAPGLDLGLSADRRDEGRVNGRLRPALEERTVRRPGQRRDDGPAGRAGRRDPPGGRRVVRVRLRTWQTGCAAATPWPRPGETTFPNQDPLQAMCSCVLLLWRERIKFLTREKMQRKHGEAFAGLQARLRACLGGGAFPAFREACWRIAGQWGRAAAFIAWRTVSARTSAPEFF